MRSVYLIESGERAEVQTFEELRPKHLKTKVEIERAAKRSAREDLWIVHTNRMTQTLSELRFSPKKAPDFFIVGEVPRATVEIFKHLFKSLLYQQQIRIPADHLASVICAKNRSDLLIGGEIDQDGGVAMFYRGDFASVVVPLSAFRPSGDGIAANFDRFLITDHGQTIQFGEYEATAESILYEFDADFRKRYRENLIKTQKGLGASIRRLRLQKGLRQSDIEGVDEKEIGRIESGKVKKPHQTTINKIAVALNVSPDDLGTY